MYIRIDAAGIAESQFWPAQKVKDPRIDRIPIVHPKILDILFAMKREITGDAKRFGEITSNGCVNPVQSRAATKEVVTKYPSRIVAVGDAFSLKIGIANENICPLRLRHRCHKEQSKSCKQYLNHTYSFYSFCEFVAPDSAFRCCSTARQAEPSDGNNAVL